MPPYTGDFSEEDDTLNDEEETIISRTVTPKIPLETMHQIVFGEGHAPSGPDRPTRDMRPIRFDVSDVSDGVPDVVDIRDVEKMTVPR